MLSDKSTRESKGSGSARRDYALTGWVADQAEPEVSWRWA